MGDNEPQSREEEESEAGKEKQAYQRKPKRVLSFRPPSVKNIIEQNEVKEKEELPTEGKKSAIEGKKGFKFFEAAKSVFGNITNMVNKKKENDEDKSSAPNLDDNIEEVE